jgi:hypothetical protein
LPFCYVLPTIPDRRNFAFSGGFRFCFFGVPTFSHAVVCLCGSAGRFCSKNTSCSVEASTKPKSNRSYQPRKHRQPNKQKHIKEIMEPDTPITLDDIQRAKAVLAQAEEALGVAQPKAKVMPAPTHPQHLEDPAFGDKTPAVVEWYRDHDPKEYRRRYAGRKTHLEDRRKEQPHWVAPERGQSANDKVRKSQETAARLSLGIAGSNLNMPRNCAENAFPDLESEVPLLHDAASITPKNAQSETPRSHERKSSRSWAHTLAPIQMNILMKSGSRQTRF